MDYIERYARSNEQMEEIHENVMGAVAPCRILVQNSKPVTSEGAALIRAKQQGQGPTDQLPAHERRFPQPKPKGRRQP